MGTQSHTTLTFVGGPLADYLVLFRHQHLQLPVVQECLKSSKSRSEAILNDEHQLHRKSSKVLLVQGQKVHLDQGLSHLAAAMGIMDTNFRLKVWPQDLDPSARIGSTLHKMGNSLLPTTEDTLVTLTLRATRANAVHRHRCLQFCHQRSNILITQTSEAQKVFNF